MGLKAGLKGKICGLGGWTKRKDMWAWRLDQKERYVGLKAGLKGKICGLGGWTKRKDIWAKNERYVGLEAGLKTKDIWAWKLD